MCIRDSLDAAALAHDVVGQPRAGADDQQLHRAARADGREHALRREPDVAGDLDGQADDAQHEERLDLPRIASAAQAQLSLIHI